MSELWICQVGPHVRKCEREGGCGQQQWVSFRFRETQDISMVHRWRAKCSAHGCDVVFLTSNHMFFHVPT